MNLGGTIKQCRKIRKLTLAQLSVSSGISVSHLCLLERNKREPSIGAVESIANALGLPLSVLVFLAAQDGEITDLNSSYIDSLSNNIMDLMSNAKG
ncbi:helix-turn-helix domain-containing protein [Hahella ganghwensis]|uniref:helix-turn-helix domain-containing protein n=1 Tax=Hahella ganghwensis TaxID=286420 RepID=UPI000A00EEF9|nr:helix-turn-helix transcriptional regulator [Hahella ganghwensis]